MPHPKLKLKYRLHGVDREDTETLVQPLRHPDDVARNRRRDQEPRMYIETDEDARAYGGLLIDAFNENAGDRPRTFVDAWLEAESGE